ncbi:hypothetical protein N7532_001224 [Penicillium argentinense]|uniref:Uncharacterized protein n=1 Tax=Penicillium argentinense TaxID=1131581 RepID=A0A9W9G226_9EURO|nr:uncharacterized protein N7532_001224 [Penicillium argentinense]KAJ5110689.1 hypothetical protein N7532_001224 [Penicillium argentinense]
MGKVVGHSSTPHQDHTPKQAKTKRPRTPKSPVLQRTYESAPTALSGDSHKKPRNSHTTQPGPRRPTSRLLELSEVVPVFTMPSEFYKYQPGPSQMAVRSSVPSEAVPDQGKSPDSQNNQLGLGQSAMPFFAPSQLAPSPLAIGETVLEGLAPPQAGPHRAAPGEAVLEGLAPVQTAPHRAARRRMIFPRLAPRAILPRPPGEAAPDEVVHGEVGPDEAASGEGAPEEDAPDEAGAEYGTYSNLPRPAPQYEPADASGYGPSSQEYTEEEMMLILQAYNAEEQHFFDQ